MIRPVSLLYPQSNPSSPELPPIKTSITVSTQVQAPSPAGITVVSNGDLEQLPGLNVDDRLRQIPGFSLFRRTSSLVANPTTQGVSLRGIGSSGASRTLLLWDGIPINDPFGGWVYWTRIPPDQIDDVEVSRGASTSLFGDRAMSGSIAIFSKPPAPHDLHASFESGSADVRELSVGGSNLWRHFATSGEVRALASDGYYVVPSAIRGAADTKAGVDFVAGNLRLDAFGLNQRLVLKLDVIAEDRANGTVLTHNSTSLGTLSANYSWRHAENGISVLAYHTREEFRASFSSVTNNRNTERLTYNQAAPSEAVGSAAYWTRNGSHYNLIAGADFERVEGYSTDRLAPTGVRSGGGSRVEQGAFGQLDAGSASARVYLGGRYQVIGDERFFSPSGGFAVGRGRFRFRGSGYRSFRAPTLNELYREFRVGNTDTLANPALKSESMTGGEMGVDYGTESLRLSATLFRNSLDRLITNVTLSSTPTAITRQRQNAAAALARGLEVNLRRGWRDWRGELAYLFADSRYETGPRVAQIPKHQGSAQLSWRRKGTSASAAIRTYSYQFDDDLNQFILPGFASVQLLARQQLPRGLSAHLAVENLLNRTYYTGFSPTPTIGAPRLWRVGVRWEGRLW